MTLLEAYRRYRRVNWTIEDANEAYPDPLCGRTINAEGPAVWDMIDRVYHHVSCWISSVGEIVGLPFGELKLGGAPMEEWLFDLTHPAEGIGAILTASSTMIQLGIKRSPAEAIVAAHNEEWRRSQEKREEEQYWLIVKHLGEGFTEVHSLVVGERAMAEQWMRHLTNGLKVDLRLQAIQPKMVDIEEMEEVQRLFREMRQHEADSQRYVGLATEARSRLKALGAPIP